MKGTVIQVTMIRQYFVPDYVPVNHAIDTWFDDMTTTHATRDNCRIGGSDKVIAKEIQYTLDTATGEKQ